MLRGLIVLLALLVAASVGAPAAEAAPVKRCGNYAPGGGAGVYRITTRVASCRTARRMARDFYRGRWTNIPPDSRAFRRGKYTCRNRNKGLESAVMRCTSRGGRVVHWLHGA